METQFDNPSKPEEAHEDRYQVLQSRHILDNFLVYLDNKSLKTARLVNKNWNNRALKQFQWKFNLAIPPSLLECEAASEEDGSANNSVIASAREDSELENLSPAEILSNVDPRLLTSVRVSEEWHGDEPFVVSCTTHIELTMQYLTCASLFSAIKKLDIQWMEKYQVEEFVSALQAGKFRHLDYLSITGYDEFSNYPWRFLPGILTNLKSLRLQVVNRVNDAEKRGELHDLRSFYQSLVQAAPNLETLQTSIGFPLSGMNKLNTLAVMDSWDHGHDGYVHTDANLLWKPLFDLLDSLRNNLTSLDLSNLFFRPKIPALLHLTNLAISSRCLVQQQGDNESYFTAFPQLKKLVVHTIYPNHENWWTCIASWLESHATSNLKEFQLVDISIPSGKKDRGLTKWNLNVREHSRSLLFEVLNISANIPRVILRFHENLHLSALLRFLSPIPITCRDKQPPQKILEFRNGDSLDQNERSIRRECFSDVVSNLKNNWSRVEFKHFNIKQAEVKLLMQQIVSQDVEIYYNPISE